MRERRTLTSRRMEDQEDSCPLTVECVKTLLERLQRVETKVTELHDNLLKARGFVAGMRLGAGSVFVLIASFFVLVYGFASGRITLKDLISGLF